MLTKPIGCICHIENKECIICIRLKDPRYSKVKRHLYQDDSIPVPEELRELVQENIINSVITSSTNMVTRSALTCIHSPESSSNKAICPNCGGGTKLKIFKCDIHTSCVVDKLVDGIMCCAKCSDYKSR